MREQVRVSQVGVATLLLFSVLVGAWHSASVQVPIIITLPTAGETTLFSDNFDTYPLGSFPSAGGWEVVWGGTGQNLIVSDPSVSKPHALQLWGKPNWSAVIQRKFSTTAPVIGYEFSIRIERIGAGTPGREESPGFFSREAATWGGYYARVFFDHDTRRIEGEGKAPLGEWSPQVWYHIKVVLDRRSNLYSVWIDGRLAGQNIRTEGDTYQINALALFSGHPGVKVWYDNVRVFTQTAVHSVSIPNAPSGPVEGKVGESLTFSVGGGGCSEPGHLVEYRVDWGDGTFSGWLSVFTLMFSPPTHAWGREGTYQIRAQVRCAVDTSIVSAWSPAKTVMIRPVTRPDLVVESITHSPASPTIGQMITFQVTVRNQGQGSAGSFMVRLQGVGPSQDRTVTSLAAGASTNLMFSLPLSASGETFTATADVNNQAAESNEGNNTRQVVVTPPPGSCLDLIPASLVGYPFPISFSGAPGDKFDDVEIPGGYCLRLWADPDNKRFVVAAVMNWLSSGTEYARWYLGELTPKGARSLALGDEGYKAEEAAAGGQPGGFRLITFRRGGYLVLVGSGILDVQATPPASGTVTDLAARIDGALVAS